MKGLPLAYGKDMQEDKEQVFDAADSLALCLAATEGMVRALAPDAAALEAAARAGFSTATDLADWLAREIKMPFREAHRVTGRLVALAEEAGCGLADLELAQMQRECPQITEGVFAVLGVRESAASRTSYGGTAPERVREQIAAWKERLG